MCVSHEKHQVTARPYYTSSCFTIMAIQGSAMVVLACKLLESFTFFLRHGSSKSDFTSICYGDTIHKIEVHEYLKFTHYANEPPVTCIRQW